MKLENFSGCNEEGAEAWLIRAERILRAGTRHKSRYIGFLSLRLRGNASTWYDQLEGDVLRNYKLFRKSFLATFQQEGTASHGATLRTLDKISQGPQETITSYHIRFEKGMKDLRRYDAVGNVAAVAKYISGLRSEYQNKAAWYQRKNESLSVKGLNTKMLVRELHARERKGRGFNLPVNALTSVLPTTTVTPPTPPMSTPTQQTGANIEEKLLSLRRELRDLRNQVRRTGKPRAAPWAPQWTADGQPICSFCKGVGHMRKACPRRSRRPTDTKQQQTHPWCDFHRNYGHSTDECRARKFTGNQDARVNAVQQERQPVVARERREEDLAEPDPAAQQRDFQQLAQE